MTEQAIRVQRIVAGPLDADLGEAGVGLVTFVDADGNPVDIGGGGDGVAYPPLTAADAEAGTSTDASTISAKVLADEIDRRVAAAIAAIPAG